MKVRLSVFGRESGGAEKRGGSVRGVTQSDYMGEEGWELEVCNWLPRED